LPSSEGDATSPAPSIDPGYAQPDHVMHPLVKQMRHDPLRWLLAFVPPVFAAQR
jgi:hypothetical protein